MVTGGQYRQLAGLPTSLLDYGQPEIFNSDQGCQFTSVGFTGILLEAGIKISMDGRGRYLDNIFQERLWRSLKYEEVYLKEYESMEAARAGIGRYFVYYNEGRPHQGLDYKKPVEIYGRQAVDYMHNRDNLLVPRRLTPIMHVGPQDQQQQIKLI